MKTIKWERGVELPECDSFAYNDPERLTITEFDECVYEKLSEMDSNELRSALESSEAIEITGYSRVKIPSEKCMFLGYIIGKLNDCYGDPDKSFDSLDSLSIEEENELVALEMAFIDELLKRYTPWACEPVFVVDVPVADWLEAHPEDREGLDL